MIGYLIAWVGIGQDWLESLPDRLDAGVLLIAELDGHLVGRLVSCLGHVGASGRCGAPGGASVLSCKRLLVKAVATATGARYTKSITPPAAW